MAEPVRGTLSAVCSTTADARVDLAATTRAPATARAFVRRAACPAHPAVDLDAVVLLVSELVTNVVQHGGPLLVLTVDCDAHRIAVRVHDGGGDRPLTQAASPGDEHGRGLALVDLISDDWGVDPHPGDGKDVWFTLRTAR